MVNYQVKQKKGLQAIFDGGKQITQWSQEYFILDDHYFIQMKDNKCALFSFDNPNKPLTQYFDLIIPALYSNDIYIAIEDENKQPFVFLVFSLSKGLLYEVSLEVNSIHDLPEFLYVDENMLVANLLVANLLRKRPEVYSFCYKDGRIISYTDYFINSIDTKKLIKQYIACNVIPIKTLKHVYLYDINGKLMHDIYIYDNMNDEDIELAIKQTIKS